MLKAVETDLAVNRPYGRYRATEAQDFAHVVSSVHSDEHVKRHISLTGQQGTAGKFATRWNISSREI